MTNANWDYLILTAANEAQAAAYRAQLELRADLGLLTDARQALVVADPGGRRVGSGGSTICCLMDVLCREMGDRAESLRRAEAWREILQRLRILIIHAGGDSRRLPAYGSCGKVFVPLPGTSDSALGTTLFDRQLPTYLALPSGGEGKGQMVITAGDVLLRFDPLEVQWNREGVNGLGCLAQPEEASRHGVFCLAGNGHVRRFLQKPPLEVQAQERAITAYGQSALDMGVFSFDAQTAARLLELSDVAANDAGAPGWNGPIGRGIEEFGLDFYREIACAFGTETTLANYQSAARSGGSRWADADLRRIYDAIHDVPFSVHVVRQCEFLHFGTSRQIITSGQQLVRSETGFTSAMPGALCMNSRLDGLGSIDGGSCWIEGCSIDRPVSLAGENVLIGVDVDQPLELPPKACLDLLPGRDRKGQPVTFVRCYGIDDTSNGGCRLCGETLDWWREREVGGQKSEGGGQTEIRHPTSDLWTRGSFPPQPMRPIIGAGCGCSSRRMQPRSNGKPGGKPTATVLKKWPRWPTRRPFMGGGYGCMSRRCRCRCAVGFGTTAAFRPPIWPTRWKTPAPETLIAAVLRKARRREELQSAEPFGEAFSFARTIHTLGSALQQTAKRTVVARTWLVEARQSLDAETHEWLDRHGLGEEVDAEAWTCARPVVGFRLPAAEDRDRRARR